MPLPWKLIARNELACAEVSYFYDFCCESGCHHMDLGASFHTAIHDTAEYNNAFVCIINGVKDQGF